MVFTVGVICLLLLLVAGIVVFCAGCGTAAHIWGGALCAAGLLPLVLYSLLIFADSTMANRSAWIGLLSIRAAFTQLMGYGLGFIESWWKRCVRGKDEFQAYEKTFYK